MAGETHSILRRFIISISLFWFSLTQLVGSECKRLRCQRILVAFACNTKIIEMPFVFLIFLLVSVFGQLTIVFYSCFSRFLLRMYVTINRLFSLNTLSQTFHCFLQHALPMTCYVLSLFTVTSIHNTVERIRNSKLGNKTQGDIRFKAQEIQKSSGYVKMSEKIETKSCSRKEKNYQGFWRTIFDFLILFAVNDEVGIPSNLLNKPLNKLNLFK